VPKSQRTKRILDDKAPKLVENVKKSLELKGANSSQIINDTLKDFVSVDLIWRCRCCPLAHLSNHVSPALDEEAGLKAVLAQERHSSLRRSIIP